MTANETLMALRACASGSCRDCPDKIHGIVCISKLTKDAADAMETLLLFQNAAMEDRK